MAAPLPSSKATVNLATGGVRVSRIRRDPPPKDKADVLFDRNERDRRNAIIGIIVFALAIAIIVIGISSFAGWTPRHYVAHV